MCLGTYRSCLDKRQKYLDDPESFEAIEFTASETESNKRKVKWVHLYRA